MSVTKHWFSCKRFTIRIDLDENNTIVWAAPIAAKFIGQPFDNLSRWSLVGGQWTLLPLWSPAYNKPHRPSDNDH